MWLSSGLITIIIQTNPDIGNTGNAFDWCHNFFTEGDATIIILPDPGASGTVSIVPSSQVIFIGEPGEYSSAYNGTASILLSRAPGIFGEVVVTWSLTPRDMTAFMQVEGSVTFLNLQQTASIILQVSSYI